MKRWYNRLNRNFFDTALPSNVCVRRATSIEAVNGRKDEKVYAITTRGSGRYCYEIILTRQETLTGTICTLAHEMIHVATEMRDDHGPAFEEWRHRIGERGFFRKNAVLRGVTMF